MNTVEPVFKTKSLKNSSVGCVRLRRTIAVITENLMTLVEAAHVRGHSILELHTAINNLAHYFQASGSIHRFLTEVANRNGVNVFKTQMIILYGTQEVCVEYGYSNQPDFKSSVTLEKI